MKFEKGVAVIIFCGSTKRFLLVKYKVFGQKHWDFPKGKIEDGEKDRTAAKREALEETGIDDLNFDNGFSANYKYSYTKDSGEEVFKDYHYLLAKIPHEEKVILSEEHSDSKWASYDEAIDLFEFDNQKEIFRKVWNYLFK